jgi:hypothetical protein
MPCNASFRPVGTSGGSARVPAGDEARGLPRPRGRRSARKQGLRNLVDGREELLAEVSAADVELRAYLRDELTAIMSESHVLNALYGSMRPDPGSQERADSVVLPRLRQLAPRAEG